MKNVEDRELDREMKALATQISVPAGTLHRRAGAALGRTLTVAGAAVVLVGAIAVGAAINNARTAKDNTGVAPTPTPAVTATATPIAFPDYPLLAGTTNGLIYRIEAGQVRGSPVDACHGQPVLAIHLSASARSILVICGGRTEGQALVLDTATLAQRGGPIAVMPRMDVGAWAPDERSIALLQQGVCDPQAPVCSVHLLLWDLASGTTRVIRPDEALTSNVLWTSVGLSVSFPRPNQGTYVWDGQTWARYSEHVLALADASGRALLLDAPIGSLGGRVWERESGQERQLTASLTDNEYPLALDGDRAMVWRETPFTNNGPFVVYRGQTEDRQIPADHFCTAAQQIDRWVVCTSSASIVLAYSLDANAFARQAITGLANYFVLVALPKNAGQGSAATSTPPPSIEARVRAEAPSLSFRPVIPGDVANDHVSVTSRGGGRDPRTGGAAQLLQFELTDQVGALLALILEGPAGCCLDSVRPNAAPNVSIGARPIGHYEDIAAAYGGPIVWWVEGDAYVSVSSPVLGRDDLLRIAASMRVLP